MNSRGHVAARCLRPQPFLENRNSSSDSNALYWELREVVAIDIILRDQPRPLLRLTAHQDFVLWYLLALIP